MTRRSPLVARFLLAFVAAGGTLARPTAQAPQSFTLDQILSFPFPEHLIASPAGSAFAWTFNERGVRNVYLAEGPEFKPRRLTNYGADDGQELTNLSFSDDGRHLVYVRGGNHDTNVPEGNPAPNPAGSPVQPKMQVWAITAGGGEMTLLGEGDSPAIAPRGHRVAFIKDGRLWIAPLDGSKPARSIAIQGTSEPPLWSPDGEMLAFASNRGDHSFIAVFTSADQPIRYLTPSTSRDSTPAWSPDGRQIAFVRELPRRGGSDSSLASGPRPWAIWVADVASESAREVWKSGSAPVDSLPSSEGGARLHWGGTERLVFLSYLDGWPHLYSVPTSGGPPLLLTPGPFAVEDASMAPGRRSIVYTANRGADDDDIDRRHIFKVPIDAAAPVQLTSGQGIEWGPVVAANGKTLAYLASDALGPPRPMILPPDGRPPRSIALDRVPADFPSSTLVTPERVIVRAPDGVDVRGQVFKSNNGSAKRPALLFLHGGPARQMLLGWHYLRYYANAYALNQYLAHRGFIVMSVNYRLGTGYGYEFENAWRAGPGSAPEYADVLAAAKYLRTRPDVDPMRVGIWGLSYGGYLTALALARDSDLFAAGVDIHGPNDLVIPELDASLAGDDLGIGAPALPVWTSPVLLIHADDDRNVPFSETTALEQRLTRRGVSVEVRVIPDDVHDFLLFRSWKTVTTATADFFERAFLKGPAK